MYAETQSQQVSIEMIKHHSSREQTLEPANFEFQNYISEMFNEMGDVRTAKL